MYMTQFLTTAHEKQFLIQKLCYFYFNMWFSSPTVEMYFFPNCPSIKLIIISITKVPGHCYMPSRHEKGKHRNGLLLHTMRLNITCSVLKVN